MIDQIEKYTQKLRRDRSAVVGSVAFAVQDDVFFARGEPGLAKLAERVLATTRATALCVARPSLPFADFLVRRAQSTERAIVPRDSETRTFLHDIPFLRTGELARDPAAQIAQLLGKRKGVLVEGVGIFACGAFTVEQAYINYSSVFHATFVKYLGDLLARGFRFSEERLAMADFRNAWVKPAHAEDLHFRQGPLVERDAILQEIATVGRYTVERWLVDSFFGNISCRAGDTVYISETAASLDELEGCIDPVPLANTSTAGITASSELPAHRSIYETSSVTTILHGHPKFPVVLSMQCERSDCSIMDCWKACPYERHLTTCPPVPIIAGETGAGGLAKTLPPAIAQNGSALVYGHGVFTTGREDFGQAFRAMVDIENWSREEYFLRLDARTGA